MPSARRVHCEAQEPVSIGTLVTTDNPAFSKLVTAFAYLICEISRLKADTHGAALPLCCPRCRCLACHDHRRKQRAVASPNGREYRQAC